MSIFGLIQLISLFLAFMSLFLRRWRRRLLIGAGLVVCVSLILHAVLASSPKKGFRLISLPEQPSRSTIFQSLIDEKDIVFIGTNLYAAVLGLKPFHDTFEKKYDDLENEIGWPLATPVLSALAEKSSVSQNWAVEFSPKNIAQFQPVIYLHGAMGSYVIQCWLVASILRKQGYSVICPALSFNGNWTSASGEKILFRTIKYIEKSYPNKKILYIGLSNGASGITKYRSRLSPKAKGFILISGGEVVRFKDSLPTLLLWGQKDENISFNNALGIQNVNYNVTLASTNEDHSAFARQHEYFAIQILSWLPKIKE